MMAVALSLPITTELQWAQEASGLENKLVWFDGFVGEHRDGCSSFAGDSAGVGFVASPRILSLAGREI